MKNKKDFDKVQIIVKVADSEQQVLNTTTTTAIVASAEQTGDNPDDPVNIIISSVGTGNDVLRLLSHVQQHLLDDFQEEALERHREKEIRRGNRKVN